MRKSCCKRTIKQLAQGGEPSVRYIPMLSTPLRPTLPEPKGRPLPESNAKMEGIR